MVIEGEAGIGKSRLVEDLVEQSQTSGVLTLMGAGDAIEKSTPYYAWRPVFSQVFNLEVLPDDHEARRNYFINRLQHDPELLDRAPLLDAVLPLDLPENETTAQMEGKVRAEKTRDLLVRLLQAYTDQTPTLLILENAQWLDSASCALTLRISQAVQPMLIVIVTRSLAEPPTDEYCQLLQASYTQRLRLDPLPPEDTEVLVCQHLGVDALPEPVAALIYSRSEGHPFFSEELAYSLCDAGVIVIADGDCQIAPGTGSLSDLNLPDTVRGVITSRIDRLPPTQQLTLKVASVIGRVFALRLLNDIYPVAGDKTQRNDSLDALQRLDFIQLETPEPDFVYIFKNVIIQEVAYNLMLFEQRQELHRVAAEWYERTYADDLSPFYPLLAHHWSRAAGDRPGDSVVTSKAIDYLQKAGAAAMQSYANQEAVEFLTQALTLLKTLPDTPECVQRELDLQTTLGPALMAIKGWGAPEVEQIYARARELCGQVEDGPQLFQVLRGLWAFYLVRAQLQTARELGEQLLRVAQGEEDASLLLEAHQMQGNTLFYRGELVPARTHLEGGIALYTPQQHRPHITRYGGADPGVGCLSYDALALWMQGYPDQALEKNREALELAQELSHPFTLAFALCFAANCHQFCREVQTFQERAEAAITLSTEGGFPQWLAQATIQQGWALAASGQGEEGIAQIRQGVADWRALGTELVQPYWLVLLADAYGKVGQAEDGLTALNEALARINNTGEGWWEAEVHRLKGELLLARSAENETEAETCFHQAIEVARRQLAKSWELRAAMSLGRLWQKQGKKAEARALLQEIYGWFTEGFDAADLKEVRALLEALS